MINRRTLPFLALPSLARAQSWPSRTITLVVPFAAGGNVDAVTRLLAPELSRRLGQNVVVEAIGGSVWTRRGLAAMGIFGLVFLTVPLVIVSKRPQPRRPAAAKA